PAAGMANMTIAPANPNRHTRGINAANLPAPLKGFRRISLNYQYSGSICKYIEYSAQFHCGFKYTVSSI
ncbi:MAG: hypothetical protein ABI575_01425, partial [Oxalobacteraceae bacterium]